MDSDNLESRCKENGFQDQDSAPTHSGGDGNIDVTHRSERRGRTALLHLFLRPFRRQLVKPIAPFPRGSPRLTPDPSCTKICRVDERQVAGIWIYDLQPGKMAREAREEDTQGKNQASRPGIVRRLYYIAGGSWRQPPSHQHWKFMAKLAAATPGTVVSVVSVPLAPHETAATAFPRLLALYEHVMEESMARGERVIWGGDSSGGNIVLGLIGEALRVGRSGPEANQPVRSRCAACHEGQRAGLERGKTAAAVKEFEADEALPLEQRTGIKPLPAPSALLVICPSVDARRVNEQIVALQDKDPILIAEESRQQASDWAGEWSLEDERISPAINHTDEDNLVQILSEKKVKVHGVTAGYDILSPDAILLRQRLEQGGVYGKWLHWDKQMHCFPLAWFYGLPESKEGLHWIIDVLSDE